jgi:hypothetical protein
MDSRIERRKCRRFEVPGAQVKYKKIGLFAFLKTFSKEHPMLNLSKGGLAFLSQVKFSFGEKLLIQLLVPNESPLVLLARVRWQGKPSINNSMITGAEFLPFGNNKYWNPIEALEVLRRLDKEYGETHCIS